MCTVIQRMRYYVRIHSFSIALLSHSNATSRLQSLEQCQLNATAIQNFASNSDIILHFRDSGITPSSILYQFGNQNTLFCYCMHVLPDWAYLTLNLAFWG